VLHAHTHHRRRRAPDLKQPRIGITTGVKVEALSRNQQRDPPRPRTERSAAPGRGEAENGPALYSGYCASCHQPSGAGTPDHAYPALFHNTATGAPRADDLLSVILYGVNHDAGGRHAFMPRFDDRSYVQPMTDTQIASTSSYVLTTVGNPKVQISDRDVATERAGGPPSALLGSATYGLPLAAATGVVGLALTVWLICRCQCARLHCRTRGRLIK
jgi:mono/diheme cytochrome c family protein